MIAAIAYGLAKSVYALLPNLRQLGKAGLQLLDLSAIDRQFCLILAGID
ncbi:MAG: hypothetical protein WAO35_04235 [Terriglobia bacterium]